MALTFKRWFAIAIVACAVITLAARSRTASARRVDAVSWFTVANQPRLSSSRTFFELERAIMRARVLQRRDSILPLLRGTSAAPELRIGADIPAPLRAQLERAVARQWALTVGSPPGDVRVAILAVLDTAPLPYGIGRGGVYARIARHFIMLPSSTDQRTCLVVVRFISLATTREMNEWRKNTFKRILGPCAFYAAFGKPGVAIETWLRGRRYDLTYNASWNESSVAFAHSADDVLESTTFGIGLPFDAVACMAGDRTRCASIVTDTTPLNAFYTPRTPMSPDLITPDDLWGAGFALSNQWFLSDLVHDRGREKFARFWTSPSPLESAFRSEMGESLGDWVHAWTTARYGSTHVGPAPGWVSAIVALSMAAAAVLGMVWFAGRRQVI